MISRLDILIASLLLSSCVGTDSRNEFIELLPPNTIYEDSCSGPYPFTIDYERFLTYGFADEDRTYWILDDIELRLIDLEGTILRTYETEQPGMSFTKTSFNSIVLQKDDEGDTNSWNTWVEYRNPQGNLIKNFGIEYEDLLIDDFEYGGIVVFPKDQHKILVSDQDSLAVLAIELSQLVNTSDFQYVDIRTVDDDVVLLGITKSSGEIRMMRIAQTGEVAYDERIPFGASSAFVEGYWRLDDVGYYVLGSNWNYLIVNFQTGEMNMRDIQSMRSYSFPWSSVKRCEGHSTGFFCVGKTPGSGFAEFIDVNNERSGAYEFQGYVSAEINWETAICFPNDEFFLIGMDGDFSVTLQSRWNDIRRFTLHTDPLGSSCAGFTPPL